MQTLEQVMKEFVNKSRARHGGDAYPLGYLVSTIQSIAAGDMEMTDRLIRNLSISLEDYK
jgi:hypothetical protein